MMKLSEMNLSEYDLRQIHLMGDKLDLFISKQLPINILINDLRGLLDCLESVDISWKEVFYQHWFMLEQIYAISLDRNESIDNYNKYIKNTIKELKELLVI